MHVPEPKIQSKQNTIENAKLRKTSKEPNPNSGSKQEKFNTNIKNNRNNQLTEAKGEKSLKSATYAF